MDEYIKLKEDIKILNELKLNNPQCSDLISEMIEVCILKLIGKKLPYIDNKIVNKITDFP